MTPSDSSNLSNTALDKLLADANLNLDDWQRHVLINHEPMALKKGRK